MHKIMKTRDVNARSGTKSGDGACLLPAFGPNLPFTSCAGATAQLPESRHWRCSAAFRHAPSLFCATKRAFPVAAPMSAKRTNRKLQRGIRADTTRFERLPTCSAILTKVAPTPLVISAWSLHGILPQPPARDPSFGSYHNGAPLISHGGYRYESAAGPTDPGGLPAHRRAETTAIGWPGMAAVYTTMLQIRHLSSA
jgi:hypothetical protein